MTIKPFGNQILIRPIEQKTLILAEKKTLNEYGEVLAVGEACKRIKVGDKVFFTMWGLNSVEVDGERHYFVQEHSDFLLGTIDGSVE